MVRILLVTLGSFLLVAGCAGTTEIGHSHYVYKNARGHRFQGRIGDGGADHRPARGQAGGGPAENIKLEDLGMAKKIVVDKDNSALVEGAGKTAAIEGRIKQIRA